MANEPAPLTQVIEVSQDVIETQGMDVAAERAFRAMSQARLALAIQRVSLWERPKNFGGCRITVTVEAIERTSTEDVATYERIFRKTFGLPPGAPATIEEVERRAKGKLGAAPDIAG